MNDKVINLKKTWRQATIVLNIIIFLLAFVYVLIYEHSLFEYPSDNGETKRWNIIGEHSRNIVIFYLISFSMITPTLTITYFFNEDWEVKQYILVSNIIIFLLSFVLVLSYEHSLFEYPSDNGEKILFYLNWLIYTATTFTIVYLYDNGDWNVYLD